MMHRNSGDFIYTDKEKSADLHVQEGQEINLFKEKKTRNYRSIVQ